VTKKRVAVEYFLGIFGIRLTFKKFWRKYFLQGEVSEGSIALKVLNEGSAEISNISVSWLRSTEYTKQSHIWRRCFREVTVSLVSEMKNKYLGILLRLKGLNTR
jgi:hypothetical protein